ncbi:CmcI family methyltransferase [Streptomyces albus]|uniref:CmcI family methyltransferase n=1 Tax=Streptomyces albus TaxID=1888 RepID=UPI00131D4100|nr:CmcI family methyltransferase [Streptomyces albus]
MVREKVAAQNGVPTFFDNRVLLLAEIAHSALDGAPGSRRSEHVRAAVEELTDFLRRAEAPRFADPTERLGRSLREVHAAMAADLRTIHRSQGVVSTLTWAGLPLVKSVYDAAIIPMLISELRPASIVELGSGSGASAVWMADVAASAGLAPAILSVDRNPVAVRDARVTFRRGDLTEIETVLGREELSALEHPWLVVEDAHVNVRGVLAHFDAVVRPGDYLVIEDSIVKRADLLAFLESADGRYALDRRYTDAFGENVTSAVDSVLIRR